MGRVMPVAQRLAPTLPQPLPLPLAVRLPVPQTLTHTPCEANKNKDIEPATLQVGRQEKSAKLSVLQKAIIEMAYRWHGTFYAADIKAEIFHWPVTYVTRHKDPETKEVYEVDRSYLLQPGTIRLLVRDDSHSEQHARGVRFESIPESTRRSVIASISRSLLRLTMRGLIKNVLSPLDGSRSDHWKLTEFGLETVNDRGNDESLTV